MPRPKLHTLESCIAAAAGCTSRNEFCAKNQGAHAAAYRNGWLDQVCPRKTNELAWTKEEIAEVSKLYATREAMCRGPHQHAHNVARKNGWLDALPPVKKQMQAPGYWTREQVTKEASKYKTRRQFMQESMGGYQAAWRNGWLDQTCSHMTDGSRTDGNCFYLWLVVGAYFNGLPVYKPGVTSTRLKFQRIKEVAKAGSLEYDLVLWLPVMDAFAIEAVVKRMGVSPQYTGFDGCTEFRAFTDDEVKQIKAMALAEFVL
jgi:hypothetical protein